MKPKYSVRAITQILSDYSCLKQTVDGYSHYVYFFVMGRTRGTPYGKFHLSFCEGEDGNEIPIIIQQFWNGDGDNFPNGEFSYPASWLNIPYAKLEKSLVDNQELKKLAKILEEAEA